jgi:DMSO/TMAO reductase YedYZ molybdopterin-dependent catalytic subunit
MRRREDVRERAWWRWWLAGAVAGALALALLWAASRLEPSIPFAPLSLAERAVRATPGDIATFVIERLEHRALPLLAVAATALFLLVCSALGWLARASGRPGPYAAGTLVAGAIAAASLAAPVTPPTLPALAAAAGAGTVYAVALAWLLELEAVADPTFDRSRRRALMALASGAAGAALAGTLLGRFVDRLAGPNTDIAIRRPDRPARAPRRPDFPSVPGLSPEITSVADHYVVDIDLVDPIVDADGWTLAVGGLVDEELQITFEQLQSQFMLVEQHSVLTCISNEVGGPLVGSSAWTGVRLGEVLGAAQPRPGAVDVVFRCADGYSASVPLEQAQDDSVLLAIAQNGRPLTQEHGFPCRVRAPALYGIKNAKWLEEIEVVSFDQRSYWTERGWTDAGAVRTQSRIDTPREARRKQPTWIAGVAWAGTRGIAKVEVSVDGGRTWRATRLRPPLSPLAWTQWAYRWTPSRPGSHLLACRATDGRGHLQARRRRPPHPSGASGYHEVKVEVA